MLGTLSQHKEGVECVPFILCLLLLNLISLTAMTVQAHGEVQDFHSLLPSERTSES